MDLKQFYAAGEIILSSVEQKQLVKIQGHIAKYLGLNILVYTDFVVCSFNKS